jgi:histone H3/H4
MFLFWRFKAALTCIGLIWHFLWLKLIAFPLCFDLPKLHFCICAKLYSVSSLSIVWQFPSFYFLFLLTKNPHKMVLGSGSNTGISFANVVRKNTGAQKKAISAVKDNHVKRLCRKAGVARVANPIYEEIRFEMKIFLLQTLSDAATITKSQRKCQIKPTHVKAALKRQNRNMIGSFGGSDDMDI